MKQPPSKICITIENWEAYAGTSRAPFYFRIPMTVGSLWKELDKFHKGVMLELLAAAGSSKGAPGVIWGTPRELSKVLSMKPGSLLKAAHRLSEVQLIQVDTDFNAAILENRKIENREKRGHFLLPDYLFGEPFNFTRIDPDTENSYLTPQLFSKALFTRYPKSPPDSFDAAYDYLKPIVHDGKWLAMVQHCIATYERVTREQNKEPQFKRFDAWLLQTHWWGNVRGSRGQFLVSLNGAGPNPTMKTDISTGLPCWEHNISDQSPQQLVINKFDNIPATISQSHPSGF